MAKRNRKPRPTARAMLLKIVRARTAQGQQDAVEAARRFLKVRP